jgi:hypothetical protein
VNTILNTVVVICGLDLKAQVQFDGNFCFIKHSGSNIGESVFNM